MMTTDREDLNQARNAVLYGGKKNSIVEWTLSPEWTRPLNDSRGYRGYVQYDECRGGFCDEIQGEIENVK